VYNRLLTSRDCPQRERAPVRSAAFCIVVVAVHCTTSTMAVTMAAIEGRSGCVAHSSVPTNSNLGATLAAMSGEARLVSGGDSGAAASEPEDCCCCGQTELGGMA